MTRFFRWFAVGLLLTVISIAGCGYWICQRALPLVEGTRSIPGLRQMVEVLRDPIGVPHILAQSFDDVIFAQGYVTAQDRLWQMDLLRRAGYGELAEIFGPRALEADKEQRILGFRRVVLKQVQNLSAKDLRLLQSYANGVNAFIESHRDRLPFEFQVLRYQPLRWSPSDSLVLNLWMGKLLSTSWKVDLMRELIYQRLGPKLAKTLLPETSSADQILLGTDEVSAAANAGSFSPQAAPSNKTLPQKPAQKQFSSLGITELRTLLAKNEWPSSGEVLGSNNWVVAGSRTESGSPLLANDPHLPHGLPSIWYMTHLQVPGVIDVSGVAIPGSPLIVLGHNQNIAWGATNLAPDVQDLYIETLDPDKPSRYRANDRWVEMDVHDERIAVRGNPATVLKVRSTRHGPVIQDSEGRVVTLRWTLLRDSISVPIQPELNTARSWEEFVSALKDYSGPVQNWVYADRAGNIGFLNAGDIPIRASGNGSVPVSGETDTYAWTGKIPFSELPRVFNPPSGLIVTANNRIVGKSYPYFLTQNWMSPHRAQRIQQLLSAKTKLNAADMLRIQGDVHSSIHQLISRSIMNAIRSVKPAAGGSSSSDWGEIKGLLESYDFEAQADSLGATVCEKFREVFLEEILKDKLGDDWKLYQWVNRSTVVENLLTRRPSEFLPRSFASYDGFILGCLEKTCQQLEERYGSARPTNWKWGLYSPIEFKHPLAAFWPLNWLLNTGPYPQPGGPLTIKQTTASHGVSMRLVVDLADLDGSFNNLTLGQSGQPFSAHYRDQFQYWFSVKSFPMLFTLPKVREKTVSTLQLVPVTLLKRPRKGTFMSDQKSIRRSSLLALALLLCGQAGQTWAQVASPAPGKSCLWKVSSKGNVVYLLGSIHLLKKTAYPLSKAIESAFNDSKKLALEVNLDEMESQSAQEQFLNKGLLPDGRTLKQTLSQESFALVRNTVEGLGLKTEAVERLKPWLLMLTLTITKLQKLGYDPAYGLDKHFFDRAKLQGKEIQNLETVEYQINLLDEMPARIQEAALLQTLKELDLMEKEFDQMVQAWTVGDAGKMEASLMESFDEFPEVYEKIVSTRNRNWVPKIEELLQRQGNTLVVVGAAHLVGAKGVVELLKQKGYNVEQQ